LPKYWQVKEAEEEEEEDKLTLDPVLPEPLSFPTINKPTTKSKPIYDNPTGSAT
jgi:hypothetical protein